MDRTWEYEELTTDRADTKPRPKRYGPLDETTSLVTKIYKTKTHLAKYGHAYLNTYSYLPDFFSMTDEQRNELDSNVENFIDKCNETIKVIQADINMSVASPQVMEHREAVIRIVKRILKDLFNHFNHLKTTRIVRQTDKQKFDRVGRVMKQNSTIGDEFENSLDSEVNLDNLDSILHNSDFNRSTQASTSAQQLDEKLNNSSAGSSFDDWHHQSVIAAENHTSIAPEEIQSLAQENVRIHDELLTLDDEVKLIGRKVVQISRLQELFTEKVMEQAVDLNNLHETAIRSSENVREGNDLIRDAMMKNASTRVFILFYIITLGFTILFLDWYNP